MRVKFWGVRGSIPVPGASSLRYGGNTPCVTVELSHGPLVVLDAGTGIRELGVALNRRDEPADLILLLSHGHWDHIQGFPFFSPAYRPSTKIDVRGCPTETEHLRRMLSDVMEQVHFPVPLESLSARITYLRLSEEWQELGTGRVLPIPTNHPGGGHGYRIEEDGKSLVYLTDNELPADPSASQRFVDAARSADILIHDSQYTDEELARYRGWGHSSIEQSVRLACAADVRILYLFHHDPDRSDEEIDRLLAALANSQQT